MRNNFKKNPNIAIVTSITCVNNKWLNLSILLLSNNSQSSFPTVRFHFLSCDVLDYLI